ncbi:alpha/beta hydrolase [Leptolyngbya cf. ectocarpi LEGE 11479]|uniref:Alpha/beta hydrolase n=1 Tax=Leptolyngbya cf. ectocarpi LEGE 11479 TaxID=1828722 RepID=A0A928ZQG1_LEPEC|nr:alpha/beta hydrolase [Leptolyngbya ectocarpi]MBE9066220.1 alpha/beta hydrolase [Leptolyngbya cf. ectocarpi LEGE 11479]
MSQLPSVLWLTVSPHLKRFDQRLLCDLSKRLSVSRWEYLQTVDEPCCLEVAIDLLHEYLNSGNPPVHLVGHGLSGIVGWLYAQRYPENVKSLTLLSVGVNPAVNWHAHYYALRQLLPCSREIVLAQMVRMLFGPRSCEITRALIQVLAQDLDSGLALHSLVDCQQIKSTPIQPPLLVCRGAYDAVVDAAERWTSLLKPRDRVWTCPESHHFFHFEHPRLVETTLLSHWKQVDQLDKTAGIPALLNH